jgi:hypothetical protein
MQVTINHRGTDYSMSVIFNTHTSQFELQFHSLSHFVHRSAIIASPYYREIADKFVQNCRFYGVQIPFIPTEEEFLGLAPQTLYPSARSKSKAAATSKEAAV